MTTNCRFLMQRMMLECLPEGGSTLGSYYKTEMQTEYATDRRSEIYQKQKRGKQCVT